MTLTPANPWHSPLLPSLKGDSFCSMSFVGQRLSQYFVYHVQQVVVEHFHPGRASLAQLDEIVYEHIRAPQGLSSRHPLVLLGK